MNIHEAAAYTGLTVCLIAALIGLWYDLSYKPPQDKQLAVIPKGTFSIGEAIRESMRQRSNIDLFPNCRIMTLEEMEEAIKQSASRPTVYKPVTKTYDGEPVKTSWVDLAFKAEAEKIKVVKPVKVLLLEESRKIEIGSIQLEGAYCEK